MRASAASSTLPLPRLDRDADRGGPLPRDASGGEHVLLHLLSVVRPRAAHETGALHPMELALDVVLAVAHPGRQLAGVGRSLRQLAKERAVRRVREQTDRFVRGAWRLQKTY